MYKILVKNRELDQVEDFKYSFYSKDNENDFETADITEALQLMNELLDSFLRKDILLVDHLTTNTEIILNKIETITVNSEYIGIINDGTTFKFYLDFSSLNKYTIVNINDVLFEEIKTYLESLGLTDIKVQPDFSIVANNPTGKPVEGRLTVDNGLFVLYSRETGTSNYITSEFSTLLDTKEPVKPEDPDDNTKFIDIYFVDEDNNQLEIDKTKLFYRGDSEEFNDDYEFANVSEIHIQIKNKGSYLIEVEKAGYTGEPYYEETFTSKSKDENPVIIKLTKNI